MAKEAARPTRMGGFWALTLGGLGIAALLMVLKPVVRYEDCPNYGGNGNASAFGNPIWDLAIMFILPAWMAAVAVEQALPVSRRYRSNWAAIVRGASAVVVAMVASCWLFAGIVAICH